MHVKQMAKNLGGVISKNSPTILTVCAVGGFVTTVIFAVRATPKACELIRRESWSYDDPREPKRERYLSKLDTIKLTYKCYIPTAAIGLASIGCIIGANSIHLRRTAALASVYSITEAAFKEYQSKVVETIGKNKELKVRDEVAADRVKENSPGTSEVIFTGKGEVLCLESLSGRYFKSDIEYIRRAINDLNRELMNDGYVSLNDIYYALGLATTKLGGELGWWVDKGLIDPSFSSALTPEGDPCLVLNFEVSPKFM